MNSPKCSVCLGAILETCTDAPSIDDLRDTVQRACENLEKARASVLATARLHEEQISLLQGLRHSRIESAQATEALSAVLEKWAFKKN